MLFLVGCDESGHLHYWETKLDLKELDYYYIYGMPVDMS